MKAVGITAEYNPLHNGHEYQIGEARRLSGADTVIVCMSGPFVQRGEPATADKWTRAGWALRSGADLVIELPCAYAVADAGRFSRNAVKLLYAAGADSVSFGSECGDKELLSKTAAGLELMKDDLSSFMRDNPRMSYPAAREALYRSTFAGSDTLEDELGIISSSNDILALEYISALGEMDFHPVRRIGPGYNEGYSETASLQSATALRELLSCGSSAEGYVPEHVLEDAKGLAIRSMMDEYYRLVSYRLLVSSDDEIDEVPSGGEGLGGRLKKSLSDARSLDELIRQAKSRRYTYHRISRLLCQLLIGIRREDSDAGPSYIRVLGFNERGRKQLSLIKKNSALPIVTSLSKQLGTLGPDAVHMIDIDIRANDIYNILRGSERYSDSDYVRKPVII